MAIEGIWLTLVASCYFQRKEVDREERDDNQTCEIMVESDNSILKLSCTGIDPFKSRTTLYLKQLLVPLLPAYEEPFLQWTCVRFAWFWPSLC